MNHKTEIVVRDGQYYVRVPPNFHSDPVIESEIAVEWTRSNDGYQLKFLEDTGPTPSEAQAGTDDDNETTGISRRGLTTKLGIATASGIISAGVGSLFNDGLPEIPLRDPDPVTDPVFAFMDELIVTPGMGAPDIEQVGEVDLQAQMQLADTAAVTSDIEIERADNPITSQHIENDQFPPNIATTTGPLGSDLVALSMGYNPEDVGDYRGNLPYYFDLAPTDEHAGRSLDEIRSSDLRTNWPIVNRLGVRSQFEPEEGEGTILDTNRTKYDVDFALLVLKPLSAGWEFYGRHPDFSDLLSVDHGLHLIIAGCHGEGTLITTFGLSDEDFRESVINQVPGINSYEDLLDPSQPLEGITAVVRVDIDEYIEESDKDGNPIERPGDFETSLEAVESF